MDMNIWNTSSQQERQNIKDFWLSLSEDDRKALLKIEKEAVLKKMKQQQKHSCSCTVCGRKRTAIEEELEVLYEGYYEELEQYAHHDQPPLPSADGLMPDPLQRRPHPLATPPPLVPQIHKTSHVREHLEEEEFSDEEEEDDEEEEYSEEEEDEEEEYSDDEPEQELEPPRGHPGVPDFFNFGSHLTVKGILTPWVEKLKIGLKGNADNLLTVADDLLKNDGRKFIEMMEQLAERRMKREKDSLTQYPVDNHSYPADEATYSHEDPLAAGEEYDDEGSYDSQEYDEDDMDEEEDEMVGGNIELASPAHFITDCLQGALTDEQRMQEGRRMFQIFAARMFEQRVLNAYREKVAAERQRKLLEELDDETKLQEQREAKRQRDAQKKKDKKKQQQQAKAEEKAKKDAEKAEEEARLKEAEEKRLEEQRRKKEEQRRKREEEKRKQEEEKARKEADKLRRQQEEQQRREDTERKAREQKAAEKARKDEARKKERDEREAREKEAKERKAQDDREKKDREAKSRTEKETKERERTAHAAQHPPHPQIVKRPSQAGMVAIPGLYPKQPQSGVSSPHPSIATPAIPKAQNNAKHRQPSQQGSHVSSPKQAQSQMSSVPSKSSSPGSVGPQQTQPKTIMQKMNNQPANHQMHHPPPTSSPLPHPQFQPPPGMQHMQQHPGGFGNMPPMGFQGFPGPQGPMIPMNRQMPMFSHQGPPMGMQNRMPFVNGVNGMNGMGPPGMMMPQGRGFPFDAPGAQPPPGFAQNHHAMAQQTSPIGPPQQAPGGEQQPSIAGHSRQQSSDKERFEPTANQPIARPAPIARPSSVKPPADRQGATSEVDELSNHLGSSALLDDSDEPMPQNPADARRHSNIAPGARNISIPGGFGPPMGGGFGNPGSTWNTPTMGMNAPFGQSPGMQQAQPGWGSLPNPGMGSWMQQNNAAFASNNAAFANNGGFGAGLGLGNGVGGHRPSGVGNRPLTIRIALCQACKQLNNASKGEGDGFHTVKALLSQIAANRPPLDSPPTLREIEEICETEGDSQNGGGELYVRRNGTETPEGSTSPSGEPSSPGGGFAVKWEAAADASTPDTSRGALKGLGEIGSPLPSKTSPAHGFGAPGSRVTPFGGMGGFQSMGAVNSFN